LTRVGIVGSCLFALACGQAVASPGGTAGTMSVAVVPFGYSDSDSRWISGKLFDALKSALENASEYSFVDRGDLEDSFSDLGFDPSDFQYGVPPDIACQAAGNASADLVVFGIVAPSSAVAGAYQILWNIGVVGSGSIVSPQPQEAAKDNDQVVAAAMAMVQSIGQQVGQRAQDALNMAEYHISIENWPMAIASLRQALQLDPGLIQAKLDLASIYLNAAVDSLDAAELVYSGILQADPQSSEALAGMGQVLLLRSLPDQAKDYFDRAIAANPDNTSAYVGLATAYNSMGMMDEAIASFESALAQNPQNLQARYALGLLYVQAENFEKAIPHIEAVLEASPDFTNLRLKLVSAYSEVGRNSDAADNAIIVLAAQPDNEQLKLYTAQLEARAGRTSDAVNRLESIISGTGDRQAYMLLATVYRDSGQYGSMQSVFSRLRSAYPNDPVANYMVGAFYYQSGTRKAQVSELVSENIPGWEDAINELNSAVSYLNQVTGFRAGQAQEMVAAALSAIALCEEKIDRVRRYSQ
jgi:tetratricopeptide (TPR) repeat protein